MIRVLVVDDSAFMRKVLSMMLESDPGIRVADTARDGQDAVEKARLLKPDVITMDVDMPRMDGISAVKEIMREAPVPIIMISAMTQQGADATMEALQAGAVDFIPKQASAVSAEFKQVQDDLIAKVKSVSRRRPPSRFRASVPAADSARAAAADGAAPGTAGFGSPYKVVVPGARAIVIGVSTGGPFALQRVIPALPASLPVPVLVVQHMPPFFTRSLADRLNSLSALRVVEAEEGMAVQAGTVYVAAGGRHLKFRQGRDGITILTPEEPVETLHRPSVDVMFSAACAAFDGRVLGVVMTGMGKDGLEGCREIRRRGGRIVVQNEETCVVYGMPKAVAMAGLANAVLPLESLAETMAKAVTSAPRASLRHPAAPPQS